MMRRWMMSALCGLMGAHALGQDCQEGWTDEFVHASIGYQVRVLATRDAGHGPGLYAGGFLSKASGFDINNIARWNGAFWEPLGGGVTDAMPGKGPLVYAITSFDDGAGPALYAGGNFLKAGGLPAKHIARWDGSAWSALGEGAPSTVRALVVHDDGSGPALYRGGLPSDGNSETVARWDGTTWHAIAPILDGPVESGIRALASFDDGSGPALYAAGRFNRIYGSGQWIDALSVARWRNGIWEAVGEGFAGGQFRPEALVAALHVFDDGQGPRLYAGGDFTTSGDTVARRVARWDGVSWQEVGGGISQRTYVSSLATFNAGGGLRLFATANIQVDVGSLYELTGDLWQSVGDADQGPMFSMMPQDGQLFVGGQMSRIGGVAVGTVAMWNGADWTGTVPAMGSISAAEFFDDGSGRALYAAHRDNEYEVSGYVRRWHDGQWEPVGDPSPKMVQDIQIFDDGSGPSLYAAGWWEEDGDLYPCARWDGKRWNGVGNRGTIWGVCLGTFDGGNGPRLFLGRTSAGDDPSNAGVLWLENGVWIPMIEGPSRGSGPTCFAQFDDGTGPALYVGGWGVHNDNGPLYRWSGKEWSNIPYPQGLFSGEMQIRALQVFDNGASLALVAGGWTIGLSPRAVIASWDGVHWSSLDAGINANEKGGNVSALAVGSFCGVSKLVAGGAFLTAGDTVANNIALWSGQKWEAVDGGIRGGVSQVLPVADGEFFVAGAIDQAGGIPSSSLAHWIGCPAPCPADCDQSNSLDLLDYLCFSALFESDDPAADCDGSGAIDLFDFLCFVNSFNAGCP